MLELEYAFQMAAWKIERADQHIQRVEAVIQWVVDPSNYVTLPYQNPESGHYGIRIGPKSGGLPHELATSAGDAVHNISSSLDYLWSGLARQAIPHRASRVNFPSHETRQNLEDTIRKSEVIKAFPAANNLILNVLKPYKDWNPNPLLWAARKLDNIDKHRLFLATMSIARLGKFIATSEDGSVIDLSYSTIQSHGPEMTFGFAAPCKLNYDAELTANVVFNEPEVFPPGKPVKETLVDLKEAASQAIQAFRDAFL